MRKLVRTGIVLSALLAWQVISVAQNVPAQPKPVQPAHTQVAQATGNAAAGQTGTVVGASGGAFGTGLSVGALATLAVVSVVAVAAMNQSTTSPATPAATTTSQ